MEQIHATCIAIDGVGVLLRGPSGAGKSDLALRLIDVGGRLVADDRADLRLVEGSVVAAPPPALAGLIEARGLGILRIGALSEVAIALVVDLIIAELVERLPARETVEILGVGLPSVRIAPFEAAAVAKVRLAVREATRNIARADD